MRLPEFATEQWMTEYEKQARFNLTDTCVPPLSYRQLLAMDSGHLLDEVALDYGEIAGDYALRKEISRLYRYGVPANVVTAPGCLAANETVMKTLLNPGDTVITFTPGYQQFIDYPGALGCKVKIVPLLEKEGWQPDMMKFREIAKESFAMIIINNPANPTGTYLEGENMAMIIEAAFRHRAFIFADEVYRDYRHEQSIVDLYENGIATSSLSKMYGLAGLRIGWIAAATEIIEKINRHKDYSYICTGPLTDTLGRIALANKDVLLERGKKTICENKRIAQEAVGEDERFSLVVPEAGTVSFLRYKCPLASEDIAHRLMERYGLLFVPGSFFGLDHYLRLSFTAQPEVMREGLTILKSFVADEAARPTVFV